MWSLGYTVGDNVTPLTRNCIAYPRKRGQRLADSLAGVARCRKDIDSAQWLAHPV